MTENNTGGTMRILLFALAVGLPCLSFAQLKAEKRPMLVASGGWVLANQHVRTQQTSFEHLSGFQAILGIEQPITRRFTVTAITGYTRNGSQNTRFFNQTERFDYFTLGVRATEYVPVGGSDLYLSIGPQLGIGVQAKRLNASGQVIEENLLKKDEYNDNDFGLNGGIGIKLPFGTSLEVGWYLGLANIYKNNNFRVYNSNLQISAGQTIGWSRFKLKKRR